MANLTNPLAVIFDMDGVIIDSNPVIIKSWKSFFSQHDIQLTDEQLNHYVFGRTAKDTLNTVFGRPLEEAAIRDYCTVLSADVLVLYETESRLVPGITDFVKQLVEENIPVGIATSAPVENVDLVLRLSGLTGCFNAISDASHVHFPKPHPEVYLTTAKRMGIDPSRCLVFEDSFSGIAAAKAAGMTVIGLSTTHTAGELIRETTEVISDFTDIDAAHIISVMSNIVKLSA